MDFWPTYCRKQTIRNQHISDQSMVTFHDVVISIWYMIVNVEMQKAWRTSLTPPVRSKPEEHPYSVRSQQAITSLSPLSVTCVYSRRKYSPNDALGITKKLKALFEVRFQLLHNILIYCMQLTSPSRVVRSR